MENQPSKLQVLLDSFDLRHFNGLNTLATSVGFLRSLFGVGNKNNSLEDIFNYLPISENFATSGQPSEQQFSLIRDAGFKTIINLAPHGAENALKDEAGLLNTLGLSYTHIPVDFKNPSEQDFENFCKHMQLAGENKVWVHCAANMRVSAFTYRYRTQVLGEDKTKAKKAMDSIWKPFGVWAEFISR